MKLLKRLWVGLLLLAAFAFAKPVEAQHSVTLTPNWQQVGQTCRDCGSAYFMLYRRPSPNRYGQYESYVYVWSNSYNRAGTIVPTYVSGPKVYAADMYGRISGQPIVVMAYHLASPPSGSFDGWNLMFYLYSPYPNTKYILTFDYLDNY